MPNKVEICGINTSRLEVLSAEETDALLRRSVSGDRAARERLISCNLRLVLRVIQRFSGRGESMDDLFQVGCIGLMKAIDHFDSEAHDVRFSTYGVPMIMGEIRRYLRDNSSVRISRSLRDTAYKVLQTRERLLAELGREATETEIAQALGIRREDVTFSLEAISDTVSLNEPVYSDNGDSICVMDQVRDTRDTDEHWLEKIALNDAVAHLNSREKQILALRYLDGKTQMEVAADIGISQAQVSRLEKNAISRIKKEMDVLPN